METENIQIRKCKEHCDTEFALRSDGGYRCKKCAVESVQKRREKIKNMAIEYKDGKCKCCGYNKYAGLILLENDKK